MKLTYWICECLTDSTAYNIRARTRREAKKLREEFYGPNDYSQPYKVTVEYDNAFDLVCQSLNEGAGWWEVNKEGV